MSGLVCIQCGTFNPCPACEDFICVGCGGNLDFSHSILQKDGSNNPSESKKRERVMDK